MHIPGVNWLCTFPTYTVKQPQTLQLKNVQQLLQCPSDPANLQRRSHWWTEGLLDSKPGTGCLTGGSVCAGGFAVDSGSPLLLLDTPGYDIASGTATLDFVVGINVDGAPCGSVGRPDLYVDLRTHADWLKQQLDRKPSSK